MIVFSLCLNEYFVSNNSVLSSSPLRSFSLNCNLSPWKTPLFADVALLDTVEVLAELQTCHLTQISDQLNLTLKLANVFFKRK